MFKMTASQSTTATLANCLLVGVHLSLALVVLEVALSLLRLVTSDGSSDRINLALNAVAKAAPCQYAVVLHVRDAFQQHCGTATSSEVG